MNFFNIQLQVILHTRSMNKNNYLYYFGQRLLINQVAIVMRSPQKL